MSNYHNVKESWRPPDKGFVMQVTCNIEKAEALLRGIPGGAEKALDAAITNARRSHSKLAEKAIREKYRISREELHKKDYGYKNKRIQPTFSKTGIAGHGVMYEIRYSGNAIPLSDFNRDKMVDQRVWHENYIRPIYRARWHLHGGAETKPAGIYHFAESLPVRGVGVYKGTSYTFDHSFVAGMQAGHEGHIHWGLYTRKEKKAKWDPELHAIVGDSTLEQLYGPSVAQMVAHEEIRKRLDEGMQERIDKVLDDKIKLILDGKMRV